MESLFNSWFIRAVLIPVIDILLLAVIFYKAYSIFLQTRAVQLVRGAVYIVVLYASAYIFRLHTVLWLLNFLAPSLVVATAIIFQPELRKIITQLGQRRFLSFKDAVLELDLDEIMKSAQELGAMKRGALIVFVRDVGQKNIIETGTALNADLSSALIVSIFSHDTPLHDGALIIEENRIVAAGAFLPLSEQQDIRSSFGTRHRAALGVAEESDAVVLVVSEETGAMSLAYDAALYYDLDPDEIRRELRQLLNLSQEYES